VKHFNYNIHDEDNRKINKEEAPQAPQLIVARGLDATSETKQHYESQDKAT